MTGAAAIEVAGLPVAVARPEGGAYRFVAVRFEVWDLDGAVFTSPEAARLAAAGLVAAAGGPGPVARRSGGHPMAAAGGEGHGLPHPRPH